MSTTPPIGKRFSHVYSRRGEPVQDSLRVRRRLAALVAAIKDFDGFSAVIPRELGIDVPYGMGGPNWAAFLADADLQDILDFITIAYQHLAGRARSGMYDTHAPARWVGEVQRIFSEENIHYSVDKLGGVHFQFDEELARSQASTIASLQAPRFQNTLLSFEKALAHLGKAPPDCKSAIRETFIATEGLFRLMFPNAPRLTGQEAARKLEPVLQKANANDAIATAVSLKLLGSFIDWIEGVHFYRHEAGREEPAQPPLMLTVHIVGLGASFIRWLAELDVQISTSKNF